MIERRAIEPDDSIGDFDRFLEIADEHERRAFVRMAPQHVDDIGARTGVDALERFVEQQQPRGFRASGRARPSAGCHRTAARDGRRGPCSESRSARSRRRPPCARARRAPRRRRTSATGTGS